MANATQGERARGEPHGGPDPKRQRRCGTGGLLRPHLEIRHGAALEGHEIGRDQGAGHALRPGDLALQRREIAGAGIRRVDLGRGGPAAGADPGESRHAGRIARHQHAVRRHPDDPAGRGGAGSPPCIVRHPLRARWRGCLYGGRGREGLHVAGRLRDHRELGAARPWQSLREAHAVARRARLPGCQFLRSLVRRLLRGGHAEYHPAGWRSADLLLWLRRARRSTAPGSRSTAVRQINYTYARTRPILERLRKSGEVDPRHGARVHYVNPINGGPVLPTMGASLALLPKGFKGEDYRSTDGTIFVCVEGQGTTRVGDQVFEWGPNEHFRGAALEALGSTARPRTSVLFSISDRPAQQALGIWREEKRAGSVISK